MAGQIKGKLLLALCVLVSLHGGRAEIQQQAPVVKTISPGNGPTKGGTIITIGGSNFGAADSNVQPRVTLGGAPCPSVVWVSPTSVLCETPDGVGADRTVIVEVGSLSSAPNPTAKFQYDSPKVLGIEPGETTNARG